MPAPNGEGCVTCQEHNVTCSYTAPRRTRFYGSVDELSDRYRCLEAIVAGAFPNDTTKTAADLVQLGQRMGFSMPDIEDNARPRIKVEDLTKSSASSSARPSSSSHFSHPSHHAETPQPSSSSEESNVSLVRDTAGNEHYIGPSGSLNFVSRLRRLVECNNAQDSSPAAATNRSSTTGVSQQFGRDDPAKALEAQLEDKEEEEEEETSPKITVDNLPMDGPSPGSITSSIARDFTRLPTTDMDEILKQFPTNDKLELLVSSYFKNVHDDFPLFHRAAFEDEYEMFVKQTRRGVPRTKRQPSPDWGWIGCLHMMVVFGSISNPSIEDVDHNVLRRRSVTVTRALLPQFISKCTLTNVRVLLLLSLFLHNNNERNAAWNLVGAATRISFALGLHRSDMNSSFRPLEREIRKWVFCTLYAFDQFLATSLGRPSGLQEVDVEIVPPREGFLDGGSGVDAKLVSLSLKLQVILSKARLIDVSRRHAELPAPYVPSPTVDEVLESLDEWKVGVSGFPEFDIPWIKDSSTGVDHTPGSVELEELKISLNWRTRAQLRAVLMLHIQYHNTAVVATRPMLLRDIGLLRKGAPIPGAKKGELSEYSKRAVKNACQLIFAVILLDSFGIINGLSGLDIYYCYCSTMILILRLLRVVDSDLTSDPEALAEEERFQNSLRALVLKSQDTINKTDMGGSMKRFAKVVDAFSECIKTPNSALRPSVKNEHMANAIMPQPQPMAFSQAPYPQSTNDYTQLMAQQPPYTDLSAFGDVTPAGMVGGFFPMSTFGSPGVNDGLVTQFPAMDEVPMPGWLDMELGMGGGYGGMPGQ